MVLANDWGGDMVLANDWGGDMVLANDWGVTVDCCGLYLPQVVIWF